MALLIYFIFIFLAPAITRACRSERAETRMNKGRDFPKNLQFKFCRENLIFYIRNISESKKRFIEQELGRFLVVYGR